MARFDRCDICDYSQDLGSEMAAIPPRANGRVTFDVDRYLCQKCKDSIAQAAFDLRPPGEVDEELILLEE